MVPRKEKCHKTGIRRWQRAYRCRSPPLLSFHPQRNDMKMEERTLNKKFYVKRNPHARPEKVEWIEMTGREFYKFIMAPENKSRCFIDFEDYMIEATRIEYAKWRKEKDHTDYLREQEIGWTTISLYSTDITESANGEDVIADDAVDVETQGMNALEQANLRRALDMLDEKSYQLMHDLYLSESPKSQREAAEEYGVCQGTIKYRAKEIRKNLKFLLLKSEKSSQ